MVDINVVALIGGGIVTLLSGYGVFRLSRAFDARAQAESILIGIGPQIIKEQNSRIERLTNDVDTIWKRERECRDELSKLSDEMRQVHRRYRHFVSALLQHLVIMRCALRKVGIHLPPFTGLDRFEEEGGEAREEWIRAIKEEE